MKKKAMEVIIDQQRDSLDQQLGAIARWRTENEQLRRDNSLIHSTLSKENISLREENALLLRRAETAERNEAEADANAAELQNAVILNMAAFETALAENRELRRRILGLHEASSLEFEDKVDALVKGVSESFAETGWEPEFTAKAYPPEHLKTGGGRPLYREEPPNLFDRSDAPELILHYKPGDEANATMEKVIKEIEDYSYVKLEDTPHCGTLIHRGGKYERDIVMRGNKCLSCGVFISDRQQYRSGVQLT